MKKFLFALICLSVFVVSCEVKNIETEIDSDFEPADLVELGIEKMTKRDFQGAIDCFIKASETDDDPQILSFLSKAKFFSGDSNGALEAINKALDRKKEKPYYLTRAEIQLSLKNFKEAASDIEQVLAISDVDSWPYFILAKINFETGKNKEAINNANMALNKENIKISSNQSNTLGSCIVFYYDLMSDIKHITKDYNGALNDINSALEKAESLKDTAESFSQEQMSEFYTKRSKIKLDMGDKEGSDKDIEKVKTLI